MTAKATTILRDKTRIKHRTRLSTTPSASTLPKIGMHIQCFVRVVAQVTGPRRAGDSKNKNRRNILKTKLTNHKLRNWFVSVTSFVVRLQFWSSPYDRSSAAMAGFSQRQLAAFWSFQVLSTVLSAQNDAMEVMMHDYLQSSQFFSHLHVLLIVHFLLSRHTERRVPRLFWTSHPENEIGMCDGFWEGVVLGTWETTKRTSHAHRWWRKKWKSNFRMQQSTFCFLARRYGHLLQRQSTRLRRTIPVAKRLAVALYYICHGESFEEVASLFHIGPSTVGKIVHEVVSALTKPLSRDSIVFPVGRQLLKTMRQFEELSGLPQCAGAVDGTFMQIVKPDEYGDLYWCYKGYPALVLFACVNSSGLFTFVDIGLPGSVGDAAAYNNSQLKRNIDNSVWLNAASWDCMGATVRPFLVGDSAFSLSPTLMKIFPDNAALPASHSSFNKVQIRTRRVVECAFGRLKKRFSVVHECHLNDPIFASEIGLLCCSLHNVIERKEKRRRTCFPNCATPLVATPSSPAIAVREALAAYCFTL